MNKSINDGTSLVGAFLKALSKETELRMQYLNAKANREAQMMDNIQELFSAGMIKVTPSVMARKEADYMRQPI